MSLISVDEALAILRDNRPSMPVDTVALPQASGARLAAPVFATVDRPPAPMSAMDGYAVRLADVREAGAVLRIIGEAPAGQTFTGSIAPGETVRIFTGAEVPEGADHILIQENANRDGDTVTVIEPSQTAAHIRAAGIDFGRGDRILDTGTVIGPAELAAIASANIDMVSIYRRPRVALLANGDELRPPGSPLGRGQIVNSNPAGLLASIDAWGGVGIDLGIAADSRDDIRAHIDKAGDADIIVPIGGASVGDHDYMRSTFADAGFQKLFEKIAVKPGKPTWFATRGGARVLGLPGNPASAFVCAQLFLKTLITGTGLKTATATLAEDLSANGRRETFLRAHAEISEDGKLLVRTFSSQDSSLISPFLKANVLIRRLANAPAAQSGEPVEIVWLKTL
ncbi:MAG: molybdopterin molybdotransferase MoeA [Henriciella sp.]|nr:molybdopterin molybdotransferase MoeA [Henriciella sp.]